MSDGGKRLFFFAETSSTNKHYYYNIIHADTPRLSLEYAFDKSGVDNDIGTIIYS